MKCPKCSAEIKRFDLSPNCKKCGVHIMYYKGEDDLARDAKKTELEFAAARRLSERIKTSFFKGKFLILRFVLTLLSVVSLLLPAFNIDFNFPWWKNTLSVGAIGIWNLISSSFYKLIPDLLNIEVGKTLSFVTLGAFIVFILQILIILALIVTYFCAYFSLKKSVKVTYGFCIVGIVLSLVETAFTFTALSFSNTIGFVQVSVFYGFILRLVCFIALILINKFALKNARPLALSEFDKKRLEIRVKVKNKEISIDDLPLPIVEGDEEKQKEAKKKKLSKGKKEGKKK